MQIADSSAASILDLDAVLERVGGDHSLLREIAEILLSEYPGQLDEVRAAVQCGDARRLQEVSHSMKGAFANLSAISAADAAYRLEMLARHNNLEEAPPAVEHLEQQLVALQSRLASLVHA